MKRRNSLCMVTLMLATAAITIACQATPLGQPTSAPAQATAAKEIQKEQQPQPKQGSPVASPAAKTQEQTSAPAKALEKVTVVQIFSSGALGPYWVTKDEGIFKKYGLDVETVFINGPQPAVAALNSSQADGLLTAPSPPTLSGAAQDMDIALVLSFSNALAYYLVAKPELKTVQDLKGKVLAVNRIGDSDYYLARSAFVKLGLNPDDIQYRAVGNMPERVGALVGGMVDATTLSPPTDLTARKQGMVQLADLGELGIPYIATSLHLRRSLIKEKPQLVENMLKALIEGTYLFRTNKEVGIKAISTNMKLEDKEVLDYTWETVAKRAEKVPYPSIEGLKEIIKLTALENPKLEGLPPEKVIDGSIVKKIEASGFIDEVYKGQR